MDIWKSKHVKKVIMNKLTTHNNNIAKDMSNLEAYDKLLRSLHGTSYTKYSFLGGCALQYSNKCFNSLVTTGLLIKKGNGKYLVSYNEGKMKDFSKRYLEITRKNREASKEWNSIYRSPNAHIHVPKGSYLKQLVFIMKHLWRARKSIKQSKTGNHEIHVNIKR